MATTFPKTQKTSKHVKSTPHFPLPFLLFLSFLTFPPTTFALNPKHPSQETLSEKSHKKKNLFPLTLDPFSPFQSPKKRPPTPLTKYSTEFSPHALQNPTDILPEFVGSLFFNKSFTWRGPCFQETVGYLNFTAEKDKKEDMDVGAILNMETRKPLSWFCTDLYAFATPFRLTGDFFFFQGHHKFSIAWMDPKEKTYVLEKGISVFLMPRGFLGTLRGMWDVLPLLSNSWVGEASQRAFLERKMGAQFVVRDKPWETDILNQNLSLSLSLLSGDFIVTSKMRGPWGAFETIQKWVSGSWSGHTAMILRGEEGEVLVAESGHYNEEGEPVIAVLPFSDWWSLQLKDKSLPHVAVLPLHSSVRSVWNNSAALSFVREMEGRKFGYHNIIFSWIDTADGNFPPPVDSQLVAAFVSMWIRVQPEYAGNLWKEALNKRLGTQGLEFPGILAECGKRKISFGELLAVPEKDEWVYSDGISTSCVAFVLSVWKKAGVFGNFSDVIQATEFTIRDAYNLKVFEDDVEKLPEWCTPQKNNKLPYCQLLGKWRFDLPGFNTQPFYPHMNEKCPSLPPDYIRPPDC